MKNYPKNVFLFLLLGICFFAPKLLKAQCNLITSVTKTDVLCYGGSTATATISVSGGIAPYTYTWNTTPVQYAATATNLNAGTKTVVVKDANGCSITNSVIIAQPAAISLTFTKTDVSCNAGANGTATVNPTGGVAPYTYTWSITPAQYTATATGLTFGAKGVTVRDANGCAKTGSVTLLQPAAITVSFAQTSVTCNGGNNGSLTATASTGVAPYTYTWNTTPAQYTQTITSLTAGSKTVTVKDANGCTKAASFAVTQAAAITATAVITNPTCNGGNNGSITATAASGVAPYTYTWNTTPTQYTQTVVGLTAGAKIVTVTDANGCAKTKSVTITQPLTLAATLVKTDVSCFGGSNGTATVSVTSGGVAPYTYTWNTTPAQYGPLATGLTAATYSCTIKDANGCSLVRTIAVAQPATALSATTTSVNVSCAGGNNGTATVTATGGVAPYTYTWAGSPTQYTATANNLSAGTLNVNVVDAKGCVLSKIVTIGQPTPYAFAANYTNVACNGTSTGNIDLTVAGATPPYNYSWSNGATTQDLNNLAAGTYTVNVIDSKGCVGTFSLTLTQPSALAASVSTTSPSCGTNGTASVSVTGGNAPYYYSWATTPAQYAATATNLVAGTYNCYITDSYGCSLQTNASISQGGGNLTLTTTQTNVSCNGANNGSATVTVAGGAAPYSYSWSTNPAQTTATAINLPAGAYMVSVSANGCTASATVSISQPAALVTNSSQLNVTCNGGNNGAAYVAVAGGTAPYTYTWNTNPAQYTQQANNLTAGAYVCTIKDANNCSTTRSVTITQPTSALIATTTQTNVSCPNGTNGTATVTATGGLPPYTYTWATTPTQYTSTATNLPAGTRNVIVVDANGCSISRTVTITQPTGFGLSVQYQLPSCSNSTNGSISATVSGGTPPYNYSWNTGATTANISNLAGGSYTLYITDANGCSRSYVIPLNAPAPLVASTSQTNTSGGNNGTATVTVSGGTPSYYYQWNTNPAQYGATATGLAAGNYICLITDSYGCTLTKNFSISTPPSLMGGLGSETETEKASGFANAFEIFPNPNNGNFQLQVKEFAAEEISLSIFTLAGQMVYNQIINEVAPNSLKNIKVSNLAKGMYMVRIEAKGAAKVESVKMLVE